MSVDDDLRKAEHEGDADRVALIRRRLGEGPAMLLATEMRSEIASRESLIRDYEYKIKECRERIEFLKAASAAILPEPCPSCSGHRGFREWLAQDECRWITCSTCRGSGFKP